MAENLVAFREVVIGACVELVALRIPWGVTREVVASPCPAKIRIWPKREHLSRYHVDAGRWDLRASERLPVEGVLDRGGEDSLALRGCWHDHQIALPLALVEALPTEEEECPVSPNRATKGCAIQILS